MRRKPGETRTLSPAVDESFWKWLTVCVLMNNMIDGMVMKERECLSSKMGNVDATFLQINGQIWQRRLFTFIKFR